ncbi:hypothetical protein [Moorena sp. SIO3H5]|uniref:hypothetical protein n=1 Tax=Moorena sp. SIO3H5 TaxID=2607834 RepID=UPI0013BB21A9|nr:hypothetical protein [Moorena sp. SIO3H5]NEO73546.1 hypothetical protein [Moorena sp. SIO3H5]
MVGSGSGRFTKLAIALRARYANGLLGTAHPTINLLPFLPIYGGLHNYQVHRIFSFFPLPCSLLPGP